MANELGDLCTRVWRSLGGAADVAEVLTASGPRAVLSASFDVTGLATASVACATLAAAEFLAAREVSRTAGSGCIPTTRITAAVERVLGAADRDASGR